MRIRPLRIVLSLAVICSILDSREKITNLSENECGFTQPHFIEVAFARFKLVDGAGCSFVYSHRTHGEEIGDNVSAWLKANGPEIEKALLEWSSMPSPALLRQELL